MSLRLKTIVSMVPKAAVAADIGSDHGKVSAELIEHGIADRVICTDISSASLEKSRRLIAHKGLGEYVSLRVGDGLKVLDAGEADVAIIAGMGGELMRNILAEDKSKVPNTLVLSCNSAAKELRMWLCENDFVIEDEALVLEARHFYPVIRAVRGNVQPLFGIALEFGPVILKKKPETLKQLVIRRIETTKAIRSNMEKSNMTEKAQKLAKIDEKLKEYNEVMKCL